MTQENKVYLDIELCDESVAVESEVNETEVLDLDVVKEADCQYAVYGGQICYTVTITNDTDHTFGNHADDFSTLVFRDVLADNLEYIDGSFTYQIGTGPIVDDEDPDYQNNTLTFGDWEIPPHTTVIVRFCVKVNRPAPTP